MPCDWKNTLEAKQQHKYCITSIESLEKFRERILEKTLGVIELWVVSVCKHIYFPFY